MTDNRRMIVLLAVLGLLLLGVALWSCGELSSCHEQKLAADRDLAIVNEIAAGLERLGERQSLASDSHGNADKLLQRAESAMQSVTGDAKAIRQVTALSPKPVEGTVYKEYSTEIRLKEVAMEDLVTFLHILTGDGMGLVAKSVKLSAVQGPAGGERQLWSADLVVSYLLYDSPGTDSR